MPSGAGSSVTSRSAKRRAGPFDHRRRVATLAERAHGAREARRRSAPSPNRARRARRRRSRRRERPAVSSTSTCACRYEYEPVGESRERRRERSTSAAASPIIRSAVRSGIRSAHASSARIARALEAARRGRVLLGERALELVDRLGASGAQRVDLGLQRDHLDPGRHPPGRAVRAACSSCLKAIAHHRQSGP